MEVYILNSNYEKIAFVDQAESILWNKKYNDEGYCEIYVPCDLEMLEILKEGNYVYREDNDMFCKITSVEIETDEENGDYIIATGTDMIKILSNRIVRWEITYSGTVAQFIKKLIDDNIINPKQINRKIQNFTFNTDNFSTFTETITINSFTDDLYELIKNICKTYNYGFEVRLLVDTKTIQFKLYKGQDKAGIENSEYIEFSPTYGNIISSNYKKDISNYKNLCYVGYKNLQEETHLLSVFNTPTEPEGEERKEIYVDGSNTSREITEDELRVIFPTVTLNGTEYKYDDQIVATVSDGKIIITDYTYLLLIRILGLNTLVEHNRTQEFTGNVDTIDTYVYKTDYYLGDVVKVINDYGIEAEARIVEIMESDDSDNGYVVEPKFEYIN